MEKEVEVEKGHGGKYGPDIHGSCLACNSGILGAVSH
jgi:hypothetical protein